MKYAEDSYFLKGEANTQAYVRAELAKLDKKTQDRFYVPEVFDFIEAEIVDTWMPYGMIVMEYVTAAPIYDVMKKLDKHEHVEDFATVMDNVEMMAMLRSRVVEFICLLLSFQPPPDTTPGPFGRGRITNMVFGDGNEAGAPQEFFDLEELQTHINESNEGNELVCPTPCVHPKLAYDDD